MGGWLAFVPGSEIRLGHAGHWWLGGIRVIRGGWMVSGPGLDRASMACGGRYIWVMQWAVHLGHVVEKALAVPG